MIKIEKISFSIGGRKLLDTGNITIPSGHKIGLVGRNGTGKTTLFELIKGDLELESGHIIIPKNEKIGDALNNAAVHLAYISKFDEALIAFERANEIYKTLKIENYVNHPKSLHR